MTRGEAMCEIGALWSLYASSESESARALVEEAIADCRVDNLESAAERDGGGGSESSEGGRTELPSGGSGQCVRRRGREVAWYGVSAVARLTSWSLYSSSESEYSSSESE